MLDKCSALDFYSNPLFTHLQFYLFILLHQGLAKWPLLALILLPYFRKALNLPSFALASDWSGWAYIGLLTKLYKYVCVCVCVFSLYEFHICIQYILIMLPSIFP